MAKNDPKVKNAYFFDLYSLANGQRAEVGPIDWVSVMEPLKDGELKDLTVEEFVFQPDVVDGCAVLGMHLPIKTDFLSQLGASAVTDVLSGDANLAKRFAHSTAIAFTGAANTIAVARGDIRSPQATSIRQFLEHFQPLGEGVHWAVEPVMDPAKIQAFLDSKGAIEFGTSFSTAKDLFDADGAAGPISFAEGMASHVKADLEVEVVVRLANGKGSQSAREKLKNLLAADLGVLARNKKSKTRAKVMSDGVLQSLDLVASKMQREFEIQLSQSESALFSDLLKGVATVGAEEQTVLMRMIEGD